MYTLGIFFPYKSLVLTNQTRLKSRNYLLQKQNNLGGRKVSATKLWSKQHDHVKINFVYRHVIIP